MVLFTYIYKGIVSQVICLSRRKLEITKHIFALHTYSVHCQVLNISTIKTSGSIVTFVL